MMMNQVVGARPAMATNLKPRSHTMVSPTMGAHGFTVTIGMATKMCLRVMAHQTMALLFAIMEKMPCSFKMSRYIKTASKSHLMC